MKALSISPEHALEILAGRKTFEYRSWQTNHRGNLLICSTQKKIPGTIPGHALIVCKISEVKKISENKYAWKLTDFKDIKPFAVKGQQRIFDVDDSKIEFVSFENDELSEAFVNEYFTPLFV